MKVWRLRDRNPTIATWNHPEADGYYYFRKDKMSPNTGIIYLDRDAAERAKRSVYNSDRWQIVSFTVTEDE